MVNAIQPSLLQLPAELQLAIQDRLLDPRDRLVLASTCQDLYKNLNGRLLPFVICLERLFTSSEVFSEEQLCSLWLEMLKSLRYLDPHETMTILAQVQESCRRVPRPVSRAILLCKLAELYASMQKHWEAEELLAEAEQALQANRENHTYLQMIGIFRVQLAWRRCDPTHPFQPQVSISTKALPHDRNWRRRWPYGARLMDKLNPKITIEGEEAVIGEALAYLSIHSAKNYLVLVDSEDSVRLCSMHALLLAQYLDPLHNTVSDRTFCSYIFKAFAETENDYTLCPTSEWLFWHEMTTLLLYTERSIPRKWAYLEDCTRHLVAVAEREDNAARTYEATILSTLICILQANSAVAAERAIPTLPPTCGLEGPDLILRDLANHLRLDLSLEAAHHLVGAALAQIPLERQGDISVGLHVMIEALMDSFAFKDHPENRLKWIQLAGALLKRITDLRHKRAAVKLIMRNLEICFPPPAAIESSNLDSDAMLDDAQ